MPFPKKGTSEPTTDISLKKVPTEGQFPQPESETSKLYSLIEKMSQEIDELKRAKGATITTEQKMYEWPRAYSFRMLDGKPISFFRMVANKVNKDHVNGGWKVDQRIEVIYFDGKREEMVYEDYAQNYTTSEKMFAQAEQRADGTWYKFFAKDHGLEGIGDFEVHQSNIN